MKTLVLLFSFLFCCSEYAAESGETPRALLYLSFDNTLDAKTDSGVLKPLNLEANKTASFTKGRKGEALKLWSGKLPYNYSTEKSFNIKAGTIAFWLQVPTESTPSKQDSILQTGKKEGFNRIEIKFSAPSEGIKTKFSACFYAKRMRPENFTLSSWGQKEEGKWKSGAWIHVMVVWDDLKGFALFYDGQQVTGPPTNNGVFAIMPKAGTIDIGPAMAVIDELYIFDKPIAPADFSKVTGTEFSAPPAASIKYLYVKK